jgi:hypothetical protein
VSIIITDPTYLLSGNLDSATTPGAELTIDTTARTIGINPGFGDLPGASDGVTFQALFSAFKLLWKNSPVFIKIPFPFVSITPEQFELVNGWTFLNTASRKAVRTAGWAEKNTSGVITAMWAGIIGLGTLGTTDQPYYLQSATGATTSFAFAGQVNEPVQVYSDPNGDGNTSDGFDFRTFFKPFCREPQKTYTQAQLSDIGVTSMTYIAYRFLLSNGADANVIANDAAILSNTAIYGGINVTTYTTNQVRSIGGVNYNYRTIIDGKGMTAEQIYTKVQYLLRQNTDIDSGPAVTIGKSADALLSWNGTILVTGIGVYIDNFNLNDINREMFTDITAIGRMFPFVATGALVFDPVAISDPNFIYRMYFTSNPGGNYGTANAVLVKDGSGVDISGAAPTGSVPFTIAYDTNTQGGRTAGTDLSVTVVGIGLNTAQFVTATAVITRGIGQNISVTAPLERNYSNV